MYNISATEVDGYVMDARWLAVVGKQDEIAGLHLGRVADSGLEGLPYRLGLVWDSNVDMGVRVEREATAVEPDDASISSGTA